MLSSTNQRAESKGEILAFTRLGNRREAFPVHQLSPNVSPLDTAERQVTCSTGQIHTRLLYAQSIHDLSQIPEHCLPTKYARVSSRSHQDVLMLFCPSFTQSERFLHADQLITRHDKLHSRIDGKRDRERVQVRCSDLAGSDLPHKGVQPATAAKCRHPLGPVSTQVRPPLCKHCLGNREKKEMKLDLDVFKNTHTDSGTAPWLLAITSRGTLSSKYVLGHGLGPSISVTEKALNSLH